MRQFVVHAEVSDLSEGNSYWNVVSIMSGSSVEEVRQSVRDQVSDDFHDHPSGNRFSCSVSVREIPSGSIRLDDLFMDLLNPDESFDVD